MKKLLIALLALGTLSFVPAEASRRHHRASCHKPSCAPKCKPECAPKCHTEVHEEFFDKPCERMVRVKGTCPWKKCTKVTTCTDVSRECVGPCRVSCPDAVNQEERGGATSGKYNTSSEGYEEENE